MSWKMKMKWLLSVVVTPGRHINVERDAASDESSLVLRNDFAARRIRSSERIINTVLKLIVSEITAKTHRGQTSGGVGPISRMVLAGTDGSAGRDNRMEDEVVLFGKIWTLASVLLLHCYCWFVYDISTFCCISVLCFPPVLMRDI